MFKLIGSGKLAFEPDLASGPASEENSLNLVEDTNICSVLDLPPERTEGYIIFKQARYNEDKELEPTGESFSCPQGYTHTQPQQSPSPEGSTPYNSFYASPTIPTTEEKYNNGGMIAAGIGGGVFLVAITVGLAVLYVKLKAAGVTGDLSLRYSKLQNVDTL